MPAPIRLTLVGGPTVLIEIDGVRLLTDPTFDPPGEYPGVVPLHKLAGPAVSESDIGPIDAVLVSHDQHSDNLDRSGRVFLAKARQVLTTPAGADRLGHGTIGLAPWASHTLHGSTGTALRVTATPARHGPHGMEPFSGDVIGFLIGPADGPDAIYVSGDTVWYEGVAEVARRSQPRIVILFAGAAEPRGPFHVTMDSNDAIEAAYAFPAARILAAHSDGWGHIKQGQDALAAAFHALGIGERLVAWRPGETVEF